MFMVASSAAQTFAGCMAVAGSILAIVAGMGACAAAVIRSECQTADVALDIRERIGVRSTLQVAGPRSARLAVSLEPIRSPCTGHRRLHASPQDPQS